MAAVPEPRLYAGRLYVDTASEAKQHRAAPSCRKRFRIAGLIFSPLPALSVNTSLCLSLSRSRISETTCLNFTKRSVHVTRGRGSVLLWRRCDMLCTSGLFCGWRDIYQLSIRDASRAYIQWLTNGQHWSGLMSTIAFFPMTLTWCGQRGMKFIDHARSSWPRKLHIDVKLHARFSTGP